MKLTTMNTQGFDDASAADALTRHAKEFEGRKFLLGLHCFWIKSQIKHGEFGPWLKEHAPDLCRDGETPKPKTQLSEAMKFCAEAADKAKMLVSELVENIAKVQIPANREFDHSGLFGAPLMLSGDAELSEDARALKAQLTKGIQLQLDLENGQHQAKQHHPIKQKTPDEIVAAENETALAFIDALRVTCADVCMDLESKVGVIAVRVPTKELKDIRRLLARTNKLILGAIKLKSKAPKAGTKAVARRNG